MLLDLSAAIFGEQATWETRLKLIDYLGESDLVLMQPVMLLTSYLSWDNNLDLIDTMESLYQNELIAQTAYNLADGQTQTAPAKH